MTLRQVLHTMPRDELIGCAVFILALCFSPLAVALIDWTK